MTPIWIGNMRPFFQTVLLVIHEPAYLDGGSSSGSFLWITLPLAATALSMWRRSWRTCQGMRNLQLVGYL
jgi:ABC-type glycerol-3-phosphate transport system permease component